jgi:predicted amidophosphoribosyltransferase
MSFCTNCGNVLEQEAKFCTNCGARQKNTSTKKDTAREIPKEDHSIVENDLSNPQVAKNEPRKKWLLVYIVVNILFVLFNGGSEEITGILIFSVIIFLMYSIRRKKDKPFNIALKILLVLQSILAFSILMAGLEYLTSSAYSLIVFACLALLIVVDIKLILNGNKT